jgi:hypothetical protein
MTPEDIEILAGELTMAVRSFRDQHAIQSPIYHCRSCGTSHWRGTTPTIYGGSVLFAARRLCLIDDEKLSQLKKLWNRYAARQRRWSS